MREGRRIHDRQMQIQLTQLRQVARDAPQQDVQKGVPEESLDFLSVRVVSGVRQHLHKVVAVILTDFEAE